MQKVIVKNLREGRAKMKELGLDHAFASMREMQVTINEELKRRASSAKLPSTVAATIKSTVSTIADLKAAINKEKSVSAKVNMLESLRSNLQTAVKAAGTDMVKSTEAHRELARVEKSIAYSMLSESISDPKAARARRALDLSNLD